jgi:hypothetical protein
MAHLQPKTAVCNRSAKTDGAHGTAVPSGCSRTAAMRRFGAVPFGLAAILVYSCRLRRDLRVDATAAAALAADVALLLRLEGQCYSPKLHLSRSPSLRQPTAHACIASVCRL